MYDWHAQRSWEQEGSKIEGDGEVKGGDLGEGLARTSLSSLCRSSTHELHFSPRPLGRGG